MNLEGRHKVVCPLFLDKDPDFEEEIFRGVATFRPYKCASQDEVARVVMDADAVITGPFEVREKAIAGMTKCKIIQALGVGYDRIDLRAAGERGIFVCNVPDYCVNEVADHTIGLLLIANRRMLGLIDAAKKGRWFTKLPDEISTPVLGLAGGILGIVGLGRIGTAVAIRAKAFGMRVLFYDPYLRLGIERSLNLDRSETLESLLENSDVVTIHTPLTDETHHMIQEDELKRMKKHALIINTARGAIIDKKALLKALREKWIAGAALDVIEDEPPDQTEPLLSLDNVVITPHRAYYSEESNVDCRRKAAINVLRVLQGKAPLHIVNEQFLRRP
jgi:D-3-phosphoglycerate dehydrogenase